MCDRNDRGQHMWLVEKVEINTLNSIDTDDCGGKYGCATVEGSTFNFMIGFKITRYQYKVIVSILSRHEQLQTAGMVGKVCAVDTVGMVGPVGNRILIRASLRNYHNAVALHLETYFCECCRALFLGLQHRF